MSLQPLLIALALLTQLPVARFIRPESYTPEIRTRAVLWYPLVGVAIAALLIAGHSAVQSLAAPLPTVLLLLAWVAVTGALHLDGLADCTDAAAAGHADREKILAIFKTPEVGAMAVVVLVLTLLLKAALLYSLGSLGNAALVPAGLASAVIISRTLIVFYMLQTPYARAQGLATDISHSQLHIPFAVQALLLFLLLLSFVPALPLLAALFSSILFMLGWRRFWLRRIGGYVGDCLGAGIEITELLVLLIFGLLAK